MAAYGVKPGIDYETALKLGSVLGGGIGRMGETCGAVTGALLVIGLKYGATDANDVASKMKTYELARKLIRQFKELNHSIICRELIGFDISLKEDLTSEDWIIISRQCPGYIADASGILEEII